MSTRKLDLKLGDRITWLGKDGVYCGRRWNMVLVDFGSHARWVSAIEIRGVS